jgi:glycosyltransferase involved in cell wall biosynthesis
MSGMKIAFITAGAAGMYCGSCMRDNTLAAALQKLGHDAVLIPTYTPIRTDEEDVSETRVFLGGVNVYLQQKSRVFRYTPAFLSRLLDRPGLLRWVSRFAARTQVDQLGDLTVSVLQGRHGNQRKEVRELVKWLTREFRPDVVLLTNVLLSGIVPALREKFSGPVIGTLQGDDIFLEALPAADRGRSIELIRKNCETINAYLVTSRYYADFMAGYLGLPRSRMHVVYPGLNLSGHGGARAFRDRPPYTIGYFARICPEKGFHHIVDAFRILRQTAGAPECRLKVSGWLGENYRAYFDEQARKLRDAGRGGDLEYVESPTHADKVRFLHSLDVLSVPTTYREPKGLYVLEALANEVPVVQPRHGTFPELIEATGGGVLVEPDDPAALAHGLRQLLEDSSLRRRLAEDGKKAVFARFTAETMARETAAVLDQYHQRHTARRDPAEAASP